MLQKLKLGFPRYQNKKTTTTARTKFIIIVKTSISSIARFAFANVWSVCVVAGNVYVTFAGVCFAFVNICQKKRKKRKEWKIGFGFYSSHICTCIKKVKYSFAIFWFHAILGLDLEVKLLNLNGKHYLKHTL